MVGGCVRDMIMGRQCHDHDIVITGIEQDVFEHTFTDAKLVGNSFPVYHIQMGNDTVEVAFARKERKAGVGYKGFKVKYTSDVTIESDLYRRDLTINAIAQDILTGEIVDPYNGRKDIEKKLVNAVSKHFQDDPVRILRAARFASVFDYAITTRTLNMMRKCVHELKYEPQERFFIELEKAFKAQSTSQRVFFDCLEAVGALKYVYPFVRDNYQQYMETVQRIEQEDFLERFCAITYLNPHVRKLNPCYGRNRDCAFFVYKWYRVIMDMDDDMILTMYYELERLHNDRLLDILSKLVCINHNKILWFLSHDIYIVVRDTHPDVSAVKDVRLIRQLVNGAKKSVLSKYKPVV